MENIETAKGKCRETLLDICTDKKFISRTPSLWNSLRNRQTELYEIKKLFHGRRNYYQSL